MFPIPNIGVTFSLFLWALQNTLNVSSPPLVVRQWQYLGKKAAVEERGDDASTDNKRQCCHSKNENELFASVQYYNKKKTGDNAVYITQVF